MGRGRKGKKQNSSATREDPESGEEEKIPASRKRGRPQKILKDDTEADNEDTEKIEENGKHANGALSDKDVKNQLDTESCKKRQKTAQVKENVDTVKEENDDGLKSITDDSKKFVGYRQKGNRRKNKPRRAAEAVVECR